jgi:hypothetical protein
MTLATNDLIKKIARANEDASLTLYNEYGEAVTADEIVTLVHSKTKARIRWAFGHPVNNISPFTNAFIHRGKTVWAAFAIRPALLDGGTDIEISYDY